MQIRLINTIFVLIGLVVGVILSLQIRANPVKNGSSAVDQLDTQKALFETFTMEQDDLKRKLEVVEQKVKDAKDVIAKRSSRQTVQMLDHLKSLTGFDTVTGEGIRITLNDNPTATRVDFSSVGEDFVQATDLRDLINGLFVQDAKAISINGKRITPLTPVDAVFDSILIDNLQISPPFVIEAVGNPDALRESINYMKKRKLLIYIDSRIPVTIHPLDKNRSVKYMSLLNP